jgi:DNA mismatch repair protein MutL
MAEIQLLDQKTIDNIAAGEVIERPASVVKELVENAIDAKATAVTVEIKDGGMTLMRVTDNGCGIPKEEVKTAFLRHATSKIRTVEDLVCVSSLGFRGEALSSISAVGQVEVITKTAGAFSGVSYKIFGGEEQGFEEIGAPDGTTFLVRNLFYNTPARRKFLKSPVTEAGYVEQIMVHMALSHPDVAFKFIHNSKNKMYTSGNGNVKDIIYHLYGREVAGALLPISVESQTAKVDGYIGKPFISRGNRNYESYFINGRYIKSKIIYKAVEDGYKTFTMAHKYPFVCLNIQVEPELLDVNVHPTKMEIRFRNERELYELIESGIKEVLTHKEIIPKAEIGKPEKKEKKVLPGKMPEPFEQVRRNGKSPDEPEKEAVPEPWAAGRDFQKAQNPAVQVQKSVSAGVNYNEQAKTEEIKQITLNETSLLDEEARPDRKVIGQLFKTYWLIEYEDQLFIMDQHAAHEKVNYEKLMKSFREKKVYSQGVEPPYVVTLSMAEAKVLSETKEVFEQLGFTIEAFGGNEFCIRQVPANLYGLKEKELFMELLDSLTADGIKKDPEMITDKIASMACKMSAKGNQRMSLPEVKNLLDLLKIRIPVPMDGLR